MAQELWLCLEIRSPDVKVCDVNISSAGLENDAKRRLQDEMKNSLKSKRVQEGVAAAHS